MRFGFNSTIIALALFFPSIDQGFSQTMLNPPFGLRWGDSPEKLITWAAKHRFNVTISLPGDQPSLKILKIQPSSGFLPDSKASSVEGSFLSGHLFEVAIHYHDANATAAVMEGRFEELKKQITREHGTLITNYANRTVDDHFVTRTESFHRESIKGLKLLLTYAELEDQLRKSKESRFTLIFRNENYKIDVAAESQTQ
jgi:hypothetical protein